MVFGLRLRVFISGKTQLANTESQEPKTGALLPHKHAIRKLAKITDHNLIALDDA